MQSNGVGEVVREASSQAADVTSPSLSLLSSFKSENSASSPLPGDGSVQSPAMLALRASLNDARNFYIACGFMHSVAIANSTQDVYVWGKGEAVSPERSTAGPLGADMPEEVEVPYKVNAITSRVASVHAGSKFTLLLHSDGSLTTYAAPPDLTCEKNRYLYEDDSTSSLFWSHKLTAKRGMNRVEISLASCGAEHILLVDSFGRAFSYGEGSTGALGHGNVQSLSVPREIAALKGKVVVSIAGGSRHSLCCTDAGDTYSWGNGANARLGLKDGVGHGTPTLINVAARAKRVACGESHSAFISTIGELFVWGAGAFGRLGLGLECGDIVTPTRVDSLWNAKEVVVQISLGMLHSACITQPAKAASRKLFVWGSCSFGKLGPASVTNQLFPVECFPMYVGFEQVCCGASHTLVLLESGEILSMGMEGASWLGKRKKDMSPISLPDFYIEAFLGRSFSPKSMKKRGYDSSSYASSSRLLHSNYAADFDDAYAPMLTHEQISVRDEALERFVRNGLLPTKQASDGTQRVAIDVVQHILFSQNWNGESGISETALQASRNQLANKRYQLRSECEKLTDVVGDIARIDRINGRIIRNHVGGQASREGKFGLNVDVRTERDLYRDATGLFSFRGFPTPNSRSMSFRQQLSYRGLTSPASSGNSLFSSCLPRRGETGGGLGSQKKRRGAGLDRVDHDVFALVDFQHSSAIFSHLLTHPERIYLLWSSFTHANDPLFTTWTDDKTPELFLALCRDLYDVSDKRSQRQFQKALKSISSANLEADVAHRGKDAEVNSVIVYKEGMFSKLLRATYLNSHKVRSFLSNAFQPFVDRVVLIRGNLDLDPFTIALGMEAAKRERTQNSQVGGLVYLKPPEEELPLDIREAYLKRMQIYDSKPDIKRVLEPKFEILEGLINDALNLVTSMGDSFPFSLASCFVDYHQSLLWSYSPRESPETCTLALMRAFCHTVLFPVLTRPMDFSIRLPLGPDGQPIRDVLFNLNQIANLIDKCFVMSKSSASVFEAPWFGPMDRVAKQLRLRFSDLDSMKIFSESADGEAPFELNRKSGQGTVLSCVPAADVNQFEKLKELLNESMRMDPFVLYPTRRTLEFVRHRVVPFLNNLPSADESGKTSELQLALEHFVEQDLSSKRALLAAGTVDMKSNVSSRRRTFASSRGLSKVLGVRRSLRSQNQQQLATQLEEVEKRKVNYGDFSDDWGFTLPIQTNIGEINQILSEDGSNTHDAETSTKVIELISRATEVLLGMAFHGQGDEEPMEGDEAGEGKRQDALDISLFTTMKEHLPSFKMELSKYATGLTEQERERNFTTNLLEKIMINHVERVKARTSLNFKNKMLDELIAKLQTGVHAFNERYTALELYQSILQADNELTQNRRAVENIARAAGCDLTPLVHMVPNASAPTNNPLKQEASRRTRLLPSLRGRKVSQ